MSLSDVVSAAGVRNDHDSETLKDACHKSKLKRAQEMLGNQDAQNLILGPRDSDAVLNVSTCAQRISL